MNKARETPRDLRKKLKRAEDSRDAWKDKQAAKQYDLKIAKSKLHSALDSRTRWKAMSKKHEEELVRLKHQVCDQDRQLQEYRLRTERLAMENEVFKKN